MTSDEMLAIINQLEEELAEAVLWEAALNEAGIDNWEGYAFAQELYQQKLKQ
jgi:hypothetical protein